ncbi:MAG TPA: zinc metalloprotease HtpX [Solirubrobacteraceae bacterium]|nr:zinc metalloprotease HtpX [Solirubrobacteraceae bacterium]
MARTTSTIGRDGGLQARMLLTLFLLGLLYVAFIGALFIAGAGAVTIAAIAAGLLLVQYFASDRIALATMGAREVSPQEQPLLHATVDRLCLQADLPKPRVAVVTSSMPNAFALGRSPKHATVCATTGILELLEPAELEGVMAHELSHVANRDVAIMTLAGFFASLAGMILQFSFFFGGDDEEESGVFFAVIASLAVYAISFFLMRALSRYREFAADRGAAVLTGRPSALASALLKISGQMQRTPQQDLRAHPEMNAFYIFPTRAKDSLMSVFATHPPLEQRLARLADMEAELQGTAGAAALAVPA